MDSAGSLSCQSCEPTLCRRKITGEALGLIQASFPMAFVPTTIDDDDALWARMCGHSMSFWLFRKGDNSQKIPLRSWILICKDSICFDPRDFVYGLLGLASKHDRVFFGGGSPIDLRPDYSYSAAEVWLRTLLFMRARHARSHAL